MKYVFVSRILFFFAGKSNANSFYSKFGEKNERSIQENVLFDVP